MAQGGGDPRAENAGADGGRYDRHCAVLSEVDWVMVASASALAAVLSLLTSVAGLPEVKEE